MNEAVIAQVSTAADEERWNLLQKKAHEVRALRAFTLFRENGIEPILIKGLAAVRYYPQSKYRSFIDMDLAVGARDLEAADKICRSSLSKGLAIDLHLELRHLDTVAWEDLFDNSRILEVEGGTIRFLRPEDHLRVLCVHWLNDGGCYKERLWDIYYAVDNRPPDFDWDRFLNVVSERRRRWLICAIGLAHRFLELHLEDTPIKDEARDLPTWLVKTVEREWASDTKLWPLDASVDDHKKFVKQIQKRLRPNPIQSTIEMEGSFDARTRIFYQIGAGFKRIPPSIRRYRETMELGRSN